MASSESRRDFIKTVGVGAATLAAAGTTTTGLAQQAQPVQAATVGNASTQERKLSIVNFDLLEEEARKYVAPARFAFTGPCGDGWTFRENRRAFGDFPIMPRRLQGVSEESINLRTKLLGHDLPFPMFVCPMGGHGMIHESAEAATARGAGMAGALYVSSGASNRPMEEIAAATPGPKWFQIYMNRDMELNRWLVQRAKAAGFSAIVLTADALGPGQADEYVRLGRVRPTGLTQGNHDPKLGGHGNFSDLKHDLRYSDITFLHEASGLPVVVKGLLRVEDIRESLDAGAEGIWISNHGGRQIDGVPASISMLRPAVDAVDGRVPVVFDSGIRRGVDVFKALAMGATAVGVGRPVLYGLAAGGAGGVNAVFEHLSGELRSAMLLAGTAKIADIKREFVALKA